MELRSSLTRAHTLSVRFLSSLLSPARILACAFYSALSLSLSVPRCRVVALPSPLSFRVRSVLFAHFLHTLSLTARLLSPSRSRLLLLSLCLPRCRALVLSLSLSRSLSASSLTRSSPLARSLDRALSLSLCALSLSLSLCALSLSLSLCALSLSLCALAYLVEEVLNVLLAHVDRQVADVHPRRNHPFSLGNQRILGRFTAQNQPKSPPQHAVHSEHAFRTRKPSAAARFPLRAAATRRRKAGFRTFSAEVKQKWGSP